MIMITAIIITDRTKRRGRTFVSVKPYPVKSNDEIDKAPKAQNTVAPYFRQLGLLDSAARGVFSFGIMIAPTSVALNLIDRANDFDNTADNTALFQVYTFNTPRLEFGLMGNEINPILTRLILDTLDSGFIAAQQQCRSGRKCPCRCIAGTGIFASPSRLELRVHTVAMTVARKRNLQVLRRPIHSAGMVRCS